MTSIKVSYTKPTPASVAVGTTPPAALATEAGLVSLKGPKGDTGATGPQGPPGPVPIVAGTTPPVDTTQLWLNTNPGA